MPAAGLLVTCTAKRAQMDQLLDAALEYFAVILLGFIVALASVRSVSCASQRGRLIERRTRVRSRFERYQYLLESLDRERLPRGNDTLLALTLRQHRLAEQLESIENDLAQRSRESLSHADQLLSFLEAPARSATKSGTGTLFLLGRAETYARLAGAPWWWEEELDALFREINELASQTVFATGGARSGVGVAGPRRA